MHHVFLREISDWPSWSEVYQSVEAFKPLVQSIFWRENLPMRMIERCFPGTNAVFRIGKLIIKIFAPAESGLDSKSDYTTELYGLSRARKLSIPAPTLVAQGVVVDKYVFRYLIMNDLDGESFIDIEANLSDEKRFAVGRDLRAITDRMNTKTRRFNEVDVFGRARVNKKWNFFLDSFNRERLDLLDQIYSEEIVYVHGDLNADNVFLGHDNRLYIIDFADAVSAPADYELVAMMFGFFNFKEAYLKGYFGSWDAVDLARRCINGLFLHDYGSDVIRERIGHIDQLEGISQLEDRICRMFR